MLIRSKAIASLLAMLPLLGCTYSVHPLLESTDLVGELDLDGIWETEVIGKDKKPAPIRIEVGAFNEGKAYDVFFDPWRRDSSEKQHYVLEFGRIHDQTFAQFKAMELPGDGPPILDAIPVYGFARFKRDGDELHLFRTNDLWCERSVDADQYPKIHYDVSSGLGQPFVIFTMPTKQLQAFVHAESSRLFDGTPMIWRRIGDVETPTSERESTNGSDSGAEADSAPK